MPKNTKEPIKSIFQVSEDKLTVIKSNPLSSLWRSELTLAEFKILDAYLARINSHCPEKRQIAVPREEFENVFGISKFNIKELDARLEHLVGQAVRISDSDYKTGFAWISLFEEARVDFDDEGVQTVYLECTQKAMKYFFNCDNLGYLRYKLRSVKNMKSRYTYILFLYLEKHRNMGLVWDEKLENLKILLNCETDTAYDEFKIFNNRILKRCQKEIFEKTECRFIYEPIRKGRKVTAIKFTLETLSKLQQDENQLIFGDVPEQNHSNCAVDDNIALLSDSCNNEFTRTQMEEILSIISNMDVPEYMNSLELGRYHYLQENYKRLNAQAECNAQNGKPIKNRYAYFIAMLKKQKE